jgi:hypothetical protein
MPEGKGLNAFASLECALSGEHLGVLGVVPQDGLHVSALDGENVIPKYVVC